MDFWFYSHQHLNHLKFVEEHCQEWLLEIPVIFHVKHFQVLLFGREDWLPLPSMWGLKITTFSHTVNIVFSISDAIQETFLTEVKQDSNMASIYTELKISVCGRCYLKKCYLWSFILFIIEKRCKKWKHHRNS